MKLVPYAEALARRFTTDWTTVDIPKPELHRRARSGQLAARRSCAKYIDWSPFFLTWELKGKYPQHFRRSEAGRGGPQAVRRCQRTARPHHREEAAHRPRRVRLLARGQRGRRHHRLHRRIAHAKNYAASTRCGSSGNAKGQDAFYSLADFIAPVDSGRQDYIGAFAVTTGIGCDELAAKFDREHDDYNSILTKALADRLAEAFAEYLHAQARRDWGYGRNGKALQRRADRRKVPRHPPRPRLPGPTRPHREADAVRAARRRAGHRHQAHRKLRHAPGRQRLAASTSPIPQARYFAVDRITRDQVEDYARRKGMSVAEIERWLAPNLGYEPTLASLSETRIASRRDAAT